MVKINDVVTPNRIIKSSTRFSTIKKTWPNGRTSAKRQWATPQHFFELEWDGIDSTDYAALLDHFEDNYGSYGVFELTDWHTNTTYNVRYANDELARLNVSPNVKGLYKLTVQFEEDKT